MPELRVCLFGGLAIACGQDSLPVIPGTAVRSLFAYLVTYSDRPHTRDLLAGTFWPDLPDAVARRRLSQALWLIRRALSPHEILVTEGDTVQINPVLPLWSDVREFEATGTGLQIQDPACQSETQDLETAAAIYGGEFMAGYYDDWVLVERERQRDLLESILERLVRAYKRRGDFESALAAARRLTAHEPWHEESHREVMRLCHLLGRDAEALRQFEICRQALVSDLGCPPSAETVALAREIAARSELAGPPLVPSTAQPAGTPFLQRPDLLPLVGRRDELAGLLRQVEAAASGNGGLSLVYGEAGVGKSRLLRELAANARWRDVQVLWGHSHELGAPLAYQPLVEALHPTRPTLAGLPLGAPWRAALALLLPELASALPSAAALAPEEERRRLLEALSRAFLLLSQRVPHVVLLEDAHWMDRASLDVLCYLVPRIPSSRLLFILSLRPGELAQPARDAVSALEGTGLPRRLDLDRLGPAETGELVARALDLAQPAPRFSARLYAETEGNPFFLVETLRELVDAGLLVRDQTGVWATPWDEHTQDYVELPLAAGVVQSIERRLARLSAPLQELLGLASIIGRDVDFRLWQSASGQSKDTVLAAADELCSQGALIVPGQGAAGRGDADYAFAHDQIRRVVYTGLAPARRRLWHCRVAEALASLAPSEAALLAHHTMQAGEWAAAATYHRQAGDRARAIHANVEAADHYGQALEALGRLPDPGDQTLQYELHLAREAVYHRLGDRATQVLDLEALTALSGRLPSTRCRAVAALRWAGYANAVSDRALAVASAEEAIHWAQVAGDQPLEAEAHCLWGEALRRTGDFEAARIHIETSLALARAASLPLLEAENLRSLGTTFLEQACYDQARPHFARALDLFRAGGDRFGEGRTLNDLGIVLRLQRHYDLAAEHHSQALQIRQEIGDRRGEGAVLHSLGQVFEEQGRLGEARACYDRALPVHREVRDRGAEGKTLANLGVCAGREGDFVSARTLLEQALAIDVEVGDRLGQGKNVNNLGLVCRFLGDYAGARRRYEQSLQIKRELGDRLGEGGTLTNLGSICRAVGDYQGARQYYDEALKVFLAIGHRESVCDNLVETSLLLHQAGADREASEAARRALSLARELEDRSDEGRALTNLGHACHALGALDQAVEAYRQALALWSKLGRGGLACEPLAGLARIGLAQDRLPQALADVESILERLAPGALDGTDEPVRVYLTCYRILAALGDARADEVLGAGRELLDNQAAKLDAASRRSFLENVPAHRALMVASERRAAGTTLPDVGVVRVSLPRIDAVRGRPLTHDDYVAVAWSPNLPEDGDIPGKVERRRCRLLRMLGQARAQGAAPTHQHLADALGVSRRTIEREVAALRAKDPNLVRLLQ